MSERIVMRIKCSRGKHTIGHVFAADAGVYELVIVTAVEGLGRTSGSESRFRSEPAGCDAWCQACGKRHPMTPDELLTAARAGEKFVRLQAEGMSRDPIGVLDRQAQRRGHGKG